MAQKNGRGSFRRYAIFGAIGVAAVVGVLLALTYSQPQRQDIVQDQPQGITGSNTGSLPYQPEVPSNDGGGTRNTTQGTVPSQTISAAISISPNPAPAGGEVTVGGGGFSPNSNVTLAFDDRPLAADPKEAVTSGNGDFSAKVTLPADAQKGEYTIKATDQSNKAASVTFNIT